MSHSTGSARRARFMRGASAFACAAAAGFLGSSAFAQASTQALRDTMVVTATKKADAENVQDVPLSVTAYGADQLDALQVRTLETLSYSQPNVVLEDIGTAPGVANFSIRGLGVNSSIPSIDPTVGVFVDGMYYGINGGVLFDIFDLESIEILRGPQGVLFGRNVTGGAVVINTAGPTDEFEAKAKTTYETGLHQIYQGSISGPIIPGVLKAKVAAYYADDEGYFDNQFDNSKGGAQTTFLVRPSVEWTPTDDFSLVVRYEHGEVVGDGPQAQNRALFDRDSFDYSNDFEGRIDSSWDQVIAEANLNVGFGDGVITNIFAYRDYSSDSNGDIDATPQFGFHSSAFTRQDQISNELRYAGRFFDRIDYTGGVFFFDQSLEYQENRFLFQDPAFAPGQSVGAIPAPVSLYGGGIQDHLVVGVFGNADIDIMERLTLSLGLRWSYEEKEARIASLFPGPTSPDFSSVPAGACNILTRDCTFNVNADPSFDPEVSFSNLSPKVGFTYEWTDWARSYFTWSRGFRSGGYNLRNTSPTQQVVFGPVTLPSSGPFDEEKVDSFEVGFKSEPLDGRVQFNAALFQTNIDNLQREVNLPSVTAGVLQVIANTSDARIRGLEIDTRVFLLDNLVLSGSVGLVDNDYTDIFIDLNGDGVVNDADFDLELPRAPHLTYNIGVNYDIDMGEYGLVSTRVNFNHRDMSFYTDNNLGFLNAADMLDAGITYTPENGKISATVYIDNALNEATAGGDTQVPFPLGVGGTFSPLNKGRVFGGELTFRY